MVANPEKFQLMVLGTNSDQRLCLKIEDKIINQCQQVKLLGITIDSKLNFDNHILELCSKVNKNVAHFLGLGTIWIINRPIYLVYELHIIVNLQHEDVETNK